MRYILICFMASACVWQGTAQAASQQQLEQELHEFGRLYGYAMSCVEMRLGKVQDAESNQYGRSLRDKFKTIPSAKIQSILSDGIMNGAATAGLSQGKQCDYALKTLCESYQAIGLTGEPYCKALQGKSPSGTPKIQTTPPSFQSFDPEIGEMQAERDDDVFPIKFVGFVDDMPNCFEVEVNGNTEYYVVWDKSIFDKLNYAATHGKGATVTITTAVVHNLNGKPTLDMITACEI